MKTLKRKEAMSINGGFYNIELDIRHFFDKLKGICDTIWGCQGPPQVN